MSDLENFEEFFRAVGIKYYFNKDIKDTEESKAEDEYYVLQISKGKGWCYCAFYFDKNKKFLWYGCYE